MTMMPLELIEQLPPEIDPAAVVDHVSVGHAPGGGYGETHLLSHGGRLLIFSRSSMLGTFEPLPTTGGTPRLERGSFDSNLYVPTSSGEARIVLSMFEVDQATALVGALHPEAIPRDPDGSMASPQPRSQPKARSKRRPQPPPTPPAPKATAKPPPPPPASKSKPPPRPSDPKAEISKHEAMLDAHPEDVVASLSLEEIYRREADYSNLARILLARVEYLDSLAEQVETLHEVADIYEILGKEKAALDILQTAYLYDYQNPKTIFGLEKLAEEHNLWNKLLTGLNDEVQNLDEISARAGILVQMSRWYRKIYSRSDYADACLMHAKRLDPQHPDVLAALSEPV